MTTAIEFPASQAFQGLASDSLVRASPPIREVRGPSVTIGEGRHSGQNTGKAGVSDS
jgi:hypothetical protein